MRIISKTHDYYDSLQDYRDTNVWIRKFEQIALNVKYSRGYLYDYPFYLTIGCVGFCGHLYRVISVENYTEHRYKPGSGSTFYTWEDFLGSLDEKTLEEYKDGKDKWNSFGRYLREMELDFKKFLEGKGRWVEWFIKYHTPCFYSDGYTLTINPNLKDKAFYRIFDIYQTFQEIEMYVFGVLGSGELDHKPKYKGQPVIAKMSNDDMITSHGFDLKTSFRKAKS